MSLITEKYFDGKVITINSNIFTDERGFFTEIYNRNNFLDIGIIDNFVQDNYSFSKYKGVIRGLHFQTPPMQQSKLISVIRGKIFDVVVDLRKNSKSYGKYLSFELKAQEMKQLYIASGFAHGFCVLEDNTEVMYKTSNPYSKENDQTILWNDKKLLIKWPVSDKNVIISKKDSKGINFDDFLSPFL